MRRIAPLLAGRDTKVLPSTAGCEPIAELGRGGMATTYLARSKNTLVVVKRPHPHLMRDPDFRFRFHHETAVSTVIRHPALVATLGAGEDAIGPYLLLEYVHGTTLEDLIDRVHLFGRKLPEEVLVLVALRTAAALRALHEAEDRNGTPLFVLHRDVTPSNVLVGASGEVKLGDLGIAKSRLRQTSTDARDLLGNVRYLAPEYLRERRVGPALDAYALGLVLFCAATGSSPFSAQSETEILRAILERGVPGVRTVRPDLGAELAEAIDGLTAPEPSRWSVRRAERILAPRARDERGQEALRECMRRFVGADLERRVQAWELREIAGKAASS